MSPGSLWSEEQTGIKGLESCGREGLLPAYRTPWPRLRTRAAGARTVSLYREALRVLCSVGSLRLSCKSLSVYYHDIYLLCAFQIFTFWQRQRRGKCHRWPGSLTAAMLGQRAQGARPDKEELIRSLLSSTCQRIQLQGKSVSLLNCKHRMP